MLVINNQQKHLVRKKKIKAKQDKEATMKDLLKLGYSLYESPTIEVMQIATMDVVRTSPGVDESVIGGGGEANDDWWAQG